MAGLGPAWPGAAWLGVVRQGSTDRGATRQGIPKPDFGLVVSRHHRSEPDEEWWRGTVTRDGVWRRDARLVTAMLGVAGHGMTVCGAAEQGNARQLVATMMKTNLAQSYDRLRMLWLATDEHETMQ